MYLGSSIRSIQNSRVAILLEDIRNPTFYRYFWRIVETLASQNCRIIIVDVPREVTGHNFGQNIFQRALKRFDDSELARVKSEFLKQIQYKSKKTVEVITLSEVEVTKVPHGRSSIMEVIDNAEFSELLKSSVASMYQTKISRSIDLSICPKRHWGHIGKLVESFLTTKNFLNGIDLQSKCDVLVFLNGRQPHQASCIEYASDWNLPWFSVEHNPFESKSKGFHFEPFLPQDFISIQKNYLEKYQSLNNLVGQNSAVLDAWFQKQRHDGPTFGPVNEKIEKNLGLNANKIFVIFTSTLSEYDYILQKQDKSWSQFEALEQVVRKIFFDFPAARIIVRIHPNQRNFSWSDFIQLNRILQRLDVEIIQPWDGTTSYSVLDLADYVVVWNSTIGLEAVYWGKKVVCMSSTFYNLVLEMPTLTPQNLQSFQFKDAVYPKQGDALKALSFMLSSGEGIAEEEQEGYFVPPIKLRKSRLLSLPFFRAVYLQLQYFADRNYFGRLGRPVLLERLLTKIFTAKGSALILEMTTKFLSKSRNALR